MLQFIYLTKKPISSYSQDTKITKMVGHMEINETPIDASRREVFEETGFG